MRVKYNRTSTNNQEGKRFLDDTSNYDLVLFDKGISGSVEFRKRPKGEQLIKLVESGKVENVVFEELSRSGRNTIDVLTTLEFFDKHNVNVEIRNIGLQSRPNGKKNPIWNQISGCWSAMRSKRLSISASPIPNSSKRLSPFSKSFLIMSLFFLECFPEISLW